VRGVSLVCPVLVEELDVCDAVNGGRPDLAVFIFCRDMEEVIDET
jgi:hypothetical protein